MKWVHEMPFGATILSTGETRFRFWAPGAKRVELCLKDGPLEDLLPMEGADDGWYELVTERARPGQRYLYRIDGGMRVPDPASRYNPEDVHGPSEIIDPRSFKWQVTDWKGRRWSDAVIYELHIGTFSPEGTFAGAINRLDHLVQLGVTAVEIMPVADFPGNRNWGYDGVLPYAPDASYGRPEDLKALVDAAHQKGLMVFLDVVYNHFGPEGNYLHVYSPQFFTERHHTPWGAAINFDGELSRPVRDFFIHNALYWLEEYRFDGLRLDAVHAIIDDSTPDILQELAEAVRKGPGREREIHLILENDANIASYLVRENNAPKWYTAQWNDDIHHALHVLATQEKDGYYADYADGPVKHLGRCIAEGFAYQGEPSVYRDHEPRGEVSKHLPPGAFVNFSQTHDQVGNRAFGERLSMLSDRSRLEPLLATVLLAPAPPMLFMGEEFGADSPFLFFCDFGPELAHAVTQGRRREFARFARFADPVAQSRIPDPNERETFLRSKLDWDSVSRAPHADWLEFYRHLFGLRRRFVQPLVERIQSAAFSPHGGSGFSVIWQDDQGKALLSIEANLGDHPMAFPESHDLQSFYQSSSHGAGDKIAPWAVRWSSILTETSHE